MCLLPDFNEKNNKMSKNQNIIADEINTKYLNFVRYK